MNEELLRLLKAHTAVEEAILNGNYTDRELFSGISQPVVTRNRINRTGQQIMLSQHYRFAEIPNHRHDYIEVNYVCKGSLTHIVDGTQEIEVKAGEMLMLNRHASHSIKKCGEDDIAVNFLVLPSFFDTTMTMVGNDTLPGKFLISSVREKSADISYLYFKVSDVQPVQNLVENLMYSLLGLTESSVREEKLTMALLFLHLIDQGERLQVSSSRADEMILAVLRQIEDNCASASLDDLADKYHVSSAYLSRLVKERTGQVFKQLLKEKRVRTACELLESTSMSAESICEAVGYDNSSYFFRIFREQTGKTPAEYRRWFKSL